MHYAQFAKANLGTTLYALALGPVFQDLCLNKHCRKDVRLPVQLQRAMAAEAEAAREARAKVRAVLTRARIQ